MFGGQFVILIQTIKQLYDACKKQSKAMGLREETKKLGMSYFFTTTRPSLPKEGTSPHQTSHPHGERLKKIIAETDDYFYVLVSRDDAMIVYRLAQ